MYVGKTFNTELKKNCCKLKFILTISIQKRYVGFRTMHNLKYLYQTFIFIRLYISTLLPLSFCVKGLLCLCMSSLAKLLMAKPSLQSPVVYVCMWQCAHECRHLHRSEVFSPTGAGVTGSWGLSDVGAGNHTWVLCESNRYYLTAKLSPAPTAQSSVLFYSKIWNFRSSLIWFLFSIFKQFAFLHKF